MRCSGWSSLAISVCSALVGALLWAASAAAHVVAMPGYLASGSAESITFDAPNERDDPMTAFSVTVPDGLEIEHAHVVDGWNEQVEGSTATWTGGSLAPRDTADFGMTLKADRDPGIIELQAEQRYPDGGVVTWPVDFTITPAAESPSQNLALAGVVGLIGVLVVVAVAMLAWRRRQPSSP
jgi:uncharacterized protein YcnI